MQDRINRSGYHAEEFVANILRIYGLSIISRNIRLKFSELDIVGVYKNVLYIIEVRKRSYINDFINVINYQKINKIYKAGQIYFNWISKIYNVNKINYYLALVDGDFNVKFINFSNLI